MKRRPPEGRGAFGRWVRRLTARIAAVLVAAVFTALAISVLSGLSEPPVSALREVRAGAPTKEPLKAECSGSLQELVDAAFPGSVVTTPSGCIYRETVVVTKPLTLQAGPGTEIRGSDVWSGWTRRGDFWVRGGLDHFSPGDVRCEPGTSRCLWPEQVFMNGRPLEQVAFAPRSGQFAVDADRNVVLADDPDGRTVEVSTRRQWIIGRASDVTIRGFTMKHAANERGLGALTNRDDRGGNYHPRWIIESNELSDAHAAVVRIDGEDVKLLGNEISRGGQLGVHGDGENVLVRGNEVRENNVEGFDRGWEAGGIKFASGTKKLTVDSNEVSGNRGVGVWCDIDCAGVVYSNNRVHHNWGPGLHFEISSGAKIFGNVVWENGWRYHTDSRQWSPGIKVACSNGVEVYGNTLAWNASGISVINYPREMPRWNDVQDVYVHDNRILSDGGFSLSWVRARGWSGGTVDDPDSGNRGSNNEYWYPDAEGVSAGFRWAETDFGRLDDFNGTPGEEGGRYMTEAELRLLVAETGIPPSPKPR